jgi:hypothetical protein
LLSSLPFFSSSPNANAERAKISDAIRVFFIVPQLPGMGWCRSEFNRLIPKDIQRFTRQRDS